MEVIEQHLLVVPFIVLYKVALAFESVGNLPKFDRQMYRKLPGTECLPFAIFFTERK